MEWYLDINYHFYVDHNIVFYVDHNNVDLLEHAVGDIWLLGCDLTVGLGKYGVDFDIY